MLPKSIKSVLINTGNVINSKEMKKKAMQTPTEEVFDSASSTFHSWLTTYQSESINDGNHLSCVSPQATRVKEEDRSDLKVSVKIFLESYSSEDLKVAISKAMSALNIKVIDSLTLALPIFSVGDKFNLEDMKPLWTELENYINEEQIFNIGVSDLDTKDLAELYQWTQVKPSINQVNLESCCVMPPELITFAKENDIQLLTHNDPKVLLPNDMLRKILEPGIPNPDMWRTNWIVRYSVIVKCRGIIQNKGYLIYTINQEI